MKSLREQFEGLLFTLMQPSKLHEKMPQQDRTWYEFAMYSFEQMMSERDAYVIGRNNVWKYKGDKDPRGFYQEVELVNTSINMEKDKQRERAQQTLGDAEDWTTNSI